eukprot:IDg3822t1
MDADQSRYQRIKPEEDVGDYWVVGLRFSDRVHTILYDWEGRLGEVVRPIRECRSGQKMHLTEELMTAKMADEDKAHTHIEKLHGVVGKLGSIGAPVSEDQYKMALLRSLPRSYESLVVALENLIDNLSVEDIHARIIREEARRAKSGADDGRASPGEKLLRTKDIICHHCSKKGHMKSKCWKLHGRPKGNGRRRNYDGHQKKPKDTSNYAFRADVRRKNATTALWYIDSSASYHCTSDKTLLVPNSIRETTTRRIELADGSTIEANKEGRRNVCATSRESDVAYALSASRKGRCYQVEFTPMYIAYITWEMKPVSRKIWHARLGHPSSKVVDVLLNKKLVAVADKDSGQDNNKKCGACLEGKMTRRHFGKLKRESKMETGIGSQRFVWTYELGQVRSLRTDNGTEYVNNAFKNYLSSKGIEHQTSAPYTPEQNGLAERTNRTLIEKARCMLRHADLPTEYWAEAISAACYLKNMTPTRVIDMEIPR